jgi:hypothetical protein
MIEALNNILAPLNNPAIGVAFGMVVITSFFGYLVWYINGSDTKGKKQSILERLLP